MELELFFNYFVFTKTLNTSNVKYKRACLNQDSAITRYQIIYRITISIYYIRRQKYIVVVIHIYGSRVIFQLFCDHQDTESE